MTRLGAILLFLSGFFLTPPVARYLLGREEIFSIRGHYLLTLGAVGCYLLGASIVSADRVVMIGKRGLRLRNVFFALLALLSPFLLFGAMEVALFFAVPRSAALYSFSRAYDFAAFPDYQKMAAVQGDGTAWRRQGFILKDGLETYPPIASPDFKINSLGVRAPEPSPPKAGAFRIALLGGSTVWGSNVVDDDTLPAQVERQLRGWRNGNAEVYNLGVEGFGFERELRQLERVQKDYGFQMAVFYDGHNDFFGLRRAARPPAAVSSWFAALIRDLRSFETYSLLEGLIGRLAPQHVDLADSSQLIAENVLWYRRQHEQAQATCARLRLACLYILQPILFDKPRLSAWEIWIASNVRRQSPGFAESYDKVVDDIMALGLPGVIDGREYLDEIREPVFGDQVHVNPIGNRVLAERIANVIRRNIP